MARVRTLRARSCPCCHHWPVGSAWNPKSASREPMGVMTVCVCRLPCGGWGSCGAGMLGPHCSHSWRPKLWWPPAPHAPLVLGLPLAHGLATCPGVVCCPALLCAMVGFPGEQISARAWTEQQMVSD